MKEYDATEQAFWNGYRKAVETFEKSQKTEAIKEFTQRVRKYLLFTKCVNDEDINEIWRYLDKIAKEMGVEL